MIKPLLLFMALRQLQAFLAPQALHFLVIDFPALNAEKCSNLAVTVAAIVFGQSDQSQPKAIIILPGGFIGLG